MRVRLSSRVPSSVRDGEQIACRWELRNKGATVIVVGFYLHSSQALVAALECTAGRVRRGRFHGSAALVLERGQAATVSAVLEPRRAGAQPVHVAVITRDESLEQFDTVVVAGA